MIRVEGAYRPSPISNARGTSLGAHFAVRACLLTGLRLLRRKHVLVSVQAGDENLTVPAYAGRRDEERQ